MRGGVKFDGCGNDKNEMKLRWDLVPFDALEKIVEIYTHGAAKYGDNNWQGVDSDRYFAALMRHLAQMRKGEKYDQDSKKLHAAHAAWNCIAIIWHELNSEPSASDESSSPGSEAGRGSKPAS